MSNASIAPSERPLTEADVAHLTAPGTPPGTTRGMALRFRVQDVFPPGESCSAPLLMLAGATNDAMLLQKLILQRQQWTREQGGIEPTLMQLEIAYFFRMLCGHLHEAGIIWWKHLKPAMGRAFEELRRHDDVRIRTALEHIEQTVGNDTMPISKTLSELRNQGAFHYDPREFNRVVNDANEYGDVLVTGLSGFNRYSVADFVLDEVVQKLTQRDSATLSKLVSEAVELARSFATIVAALLWTRFGERRSRISIITEGLVQIPPALERARAR